MKGYIGRRGFAYPRGLFAIRYAGALLAVAVGTLLASWLQSVLDPSVVLLIAILGAAWFSGFWPALIAAVAATLSYDYFFTPPLYTFTPEVAHIPRLVVFALVAALFVSISAGRSRAERSLKQTRDELESRVRERTADLREQANLLDLTHDTIFVRDMNDVIRYWNRGAEELYGWTAEEALGAVTHTLLQTIFPVPLHQVKTHLITHGRWEGELVHTRRDGTRVVVASRWSLQRGPDGLPLAVLETNNDISERKQAEDKVLRSEASLAEAQRLSHIGSWVEDRVAGAFTVSPELRRICGYSSTETVTRDTLLQGVSPADLAEVERVVGAALREGTDFEFEHRFVRRDGSFRYLHVVGHPVINESGAVVEVVGSVADVTERRRAEAELRESERRHRHIFQATGVSIWEEDFSAVTAAVDEVKRSGVDFREFLKSSPQFIDDAIALVRIVDVNEATLKLFGASSKEELLVSLDRVFTPDTRDVFAGELAALAEGRPSFEGETVMKTLQGDRIVVLFSASFPPPDADVHAVLVSIIDITDRKRAEQELEELAGRLINAQEEERSRIGRELHDHISQMLGVLTIRMDQLRADEGTPPTVAVALNDLRESAAEITTDIHSLSHRLHSSALDYLGLVPAVQKLVSEFSSRHGIHIDFEHGALPPSVPSEIALCLFRVTEESLTNVAKHSQAASARVRVDSTGGGISLSIDDAGKGFDPDSLERKAGLGFVSMRERLRVLRGTVRVTSVPGRGTRIDAWVPVHLAPRLAPGPSPSASMDTHPRV